MKYRVKFQCYQYNTGSANNGHYTNNEDFDTLKDAITFAGRVNTQYEMYSKQHSLYDANSDTITEYQRKYCLTKQEFDAWEENWEPIEIETGYISGPAKIVKYYPAREEELT